MEQTRETIPTFQPPIAYVGDGMWVCPKHAFFLWGQWENGLNEVLDGEGNPLYPVFPWDESASWGDPYSCEWCSFLKK